MLGKHDYMMVLNEDVIAKVEEFIDFLDNRTVDLKENLGDFETLTEQYINLKIERTALEASLPILKEQMNRVKERIDDLEEKDLASCPLCDQPISEEHRETVLLELQLEGKAMGARFLANHQTMEALSKSLKLLETLMSGKESDYT